jgi:hypothetical protein
MIASRAMPPYSDPSPSSSSVISRSSMGGTKLMTVHTSVATIEIVYSPLNRDASRARRQSSFMLMIQPLAS